MISLLKGPGADWVVMYINNEGYTIFKRYEDLQKMFFERFIDLNLLGIALAKLLQLKQECTKIQEYATKALTLAY